jgi:hypothetical protein
VKDHCHIIGYPWIECCHGLFVVETGAAPFYFFFNFCTGSTDNFYDGFHFGLLGHPVVGGSWEGFVIENIMAVVPSRVQPYYYGTPRGAEIDLVLEFPGGKKWAIEIKRNSSPSLSKGFTPGVKT